jgi:hypothetical protein
MRFATFAHAMSRHERDGAEHDEHHRPDIARDVLAVRARATQSTRVRVAESLLELTHRRDEARPRLVPR